MTVRIQYTTFEVLMSDKDGKRHITAICYTCSRKLQNIKPPSILHEQVQRLLQRLAHLEKIQVTLFFMCPWGQTANYRLG
jgi:hypothetical protein